MPPALIKRYSADEKSYTLLNEYGNDLSHPLLPLMSASLNAASRMIEKRMSCFCLPVCVKALKKSACTFLRLDIADEEGV